VSVEEFRAGVESGDPDRAFAALSEDVVFNSPVAFKPFEGRETVSAVLRAVIEVFEDFRYVAELPGDDVHGLLFEARVGEKSVQGIDLFRTGLDGKIAELTVMLRPASALMAMGEAMAPRVAGLAKG
jgi:SnoaL-like protein